MKIWSWNFSRLDGWGRMQPWPPCCYNFFAQNYPKKIIISYGRSCGRFCGRRPRKVFPEGIQDSRKVLAEGSYGRLCGRLYRKVCSKLSFFWTEGSCGRFLRKVLRKVLLKVLQKVFPEGTRDLRKVRRKVPRKVFAEGSAEGFCGRVRGRFLRKGPRKGFAEGFCGRVRGRIPEGFPRKDEKLILTKNIVHL